MARATTTDRWSTWAWKWQRIKRLADLLAFNPHLLQAADDIVTGLDRYCELNDIDPARIQLGDAKFIKGLDYVEYPLLEDGK